MVKSIQDIAPFKRNMGIELTWVPQKYPKPPMYKRGEPGYYNHINFHDLCDKLDDKLRGYRTYGEPLYEVDHSEGGFFDAPNAYDVVSVHTDPGCVETPTRVLVDWHDAQDVYERVSSAAKEVGLVPYEHHQETGMGHIHTSMTIPEARAIQWDVMNRPYLPWVFVSPNQTDSCAGFHSGHIVDELPVKYKKPNPEHWHASGLNASKTKTVRFCREGRWEPVPNTDKTRTKFIEEPHHLEWRAFDAAYDWKEQEEHIAFLQRYYDWVVKNPRPFPKHAVSIDRHHATALAAPFFNSKDLCAKAFKKLIVDELCLPWGRYKHYMDQNLDAQFAWGNRE